MRYRRERSTIRTPCGHRNFFWDVRPASQKVPTAIVNQLTLQTLTWASLGALPTLLHASSFGYPTPLQRMTHFQTRHRHMGSMKEAITIRFNWSIFNCSNIIYKHNKEGADDYDSTLFFRFPLVIFLRNVFSDGFDPDIFIVPEHLEQYSDSKTVETITLIHGLKVWFSRVYRG